MIETLLKTPVNQMLNTIDKEHIARNRKILESIVDAIILCVYHCVVIVMTALLKVHWCNYINNVTNLITFM